MTNDNSCDGCTSRRSFLRDATLIAAGVLASLNAGDAAALPVEWIAPLSTTTSSVSYPVPMQNGVSIDRKNEIVLTRWDNVIYAFALSCPHQKTSLRWIEADSRFQCPKHKSKYQPDGTFISGKATRGMDRYALRRNGSVIIVDTAVMYKQDKNGPEWIAAELRVAEGEK